MDLTRDGWAVHTWGRVAHSMYFTLIPEQGAIGCALFFFVTVWCFRLHRRIRREWHKDPENPDKRSLALLASASAAGLFAVLATGAFLSVLYYPVFWIQIGMTTSLEAALAGLSAQETPAPAVSVAVRRRSMARHA